MDPCKFLLLLLLCSSVSANTKLWKADELPNPMSDDGWQACLLRSPGTVCDPDRVLTDAERTSLSQKLSNIQRITARDRTGGMCDKKGINIMIAVVKEVQKSGAATAERDLELICDALRRKYWSPDSCGKTIVILESINDKKLHTSFGKSSGLASGDANAAFENQKSHFRNGRHFEGLSGMADQYKNIFNTKVNRPTSHSSGGGAGPNIYDGRDNSKLEFKPIKIPWFVWVIIAILLCTLLCCCCLCLCCKSLRSCFCPCADKARGGGGGGGGYNQSGGGYNQGGGGGYDQSGSGAMPMGMDYGGANFGNGGGGRFGGLFNRGGGGGGGFGGAMAGLGGLGALRGLMGGRKNRGHNYGAPEMGGVGYIDPHAGDPYINGGGFGEDGGTHEEQPPPYVGEEGGGGGSWGDPDPPQPSQPEPGPTSTTDLYPSIDNSGGGGSVSVEGGTGGGGGGEGGNTSGGGGGGGGGGW